MNYVYVKALPLCEIEHEARDQDALQHQGHMPSALFHVKHEQGNALTILKNFQVLIK